MSSFTLALIAAVADNGVIGCDNRLPWHLPADLKHFKAMTLGKPIIMGRKTWDSLGRPLPGRLNIVVSRQQGLQLPGAEVFDTLQAALQRAEAWAAAQSVNELMLIGGGELYAQALPFAQRLYLTRVHTAPAGDAVFPEFSNAEWQRERADFYAATPESPAHTYEQWIRPR